MNKIPLPPTNDPLSNEPDIISDIDYNIFAPQGDFVFGTVPFDKVYPYEYPL